MRKWTILGKSYRPRQLISHSKSPCHFGNWEIFKFNAKSNLNYLFIWNLGWVVCKEGLGNSEPFLFADGPIECLWKYLHLKLRYKDYATFDYRQLKCVTYHLQIMRNFPDTKPLIHHRRDNSTHHLYHKHLTQRCEIKCIKINNYCT